MTRVLIAINEPVLAAGLESTLKAGGFETTDICEDVVQLFESIERLRPDVIILDTDISSGMSIVSELRTAVPHCQLVLWSRNFSPEAAREAIRLGARGVIPASVSPVQFLEAMHMLVAFPLPQPTPASIMRRLCNPTEQKVIAFVGCGMQDFEIASVMRIDESTVNRLVRDVSRRLGAEDRCELALYGLSAGKEPLQTEVEN